MRSTNEPSLPANAPEGWLSVGDDAKACAAWVAKCQRDNPEYWTTERMMTLLYAHRHNMMRSVEAALKPEWEEASRRVFEDGNSGWTQVVAEAVRMARERIPEG
jgi:hypothetical protein